MKAAQLPTVLVDDASHDSSLKDQIGSSEVPRPSYESQHCRCEGVRRVRHHAERSSWRDEVLQIALHYSGVAVDHFLPKRARPAGVQLDRDDAGASLEKRHSKGTGAGTQVDYQLAAPNRSASNNLLNPVRIQPVPAPGPPPGHDAPCRSSS